MLSEKKALTCSLCGGKTKILFDTRDYRRPQAVESHSIGWCDECRYGRINRELDPVEVSEFYDIDYYTHGTSVESKRDESILERILTHIAWRLDGGQDFSPSEVGIPGRLMDIGCGEGLNMKNLKSAGFDVVGVEPDPKARLEAQKYGHVFAGTAEAPPSELVGKYEYALLSHVLEHTISPSQALSMISERLVSGGKLIVEVPNCDAAGFAEFGPVWPWTDVPRHIHFFSRSSLSVLLERAGFSVSKVFFTGYTRQFKPEWIAELNAIHAALGDATFAHSSSRGARGLTRSMRVLLRTAFARPERKYDSIRMHAIKA
jgi:SAM-dependent methyltransferase